MPSPSPDPGSAAHLDRLVAESQWVRRLALAVARDAHAAEDLAQDAWLAALETPPRDPARRRGWFARVVSNLERLRARGDSNRGARERSVARREGEEDPTLALERIEMQEVLLRCVRALAEPYRSTVVLRYFEGLDPVEVGRRLGIPLRTVHTRTTRALALLREALDRRSGGDRSRWITAWIPLLPGTRSGPWIALVNAKLKIGLAVAASLLLVVVLRKDRVQELPPPISASTASAPVVVEEEPAPAEPDVPRPRTAVEPPRFAAASPFSPPPNLDPCAVPSNELARTSAPGTIEGAAWVSGAGFGRGGIARLHLATTPSASDADRVGIDPGGAFRFERVAPGSYRVGVEIEHGVERLRDCEVVDGVPTPRVIFALGGGEVRGRAYDQDGRAIPGEHVVLERRDARWWATGESATTRTLRDGSFRFPARCGGRYFVSLRIGDAEPGAGDAFGFDLATGETKTITFGSRRGLHAWSGKVLGPDGWPLAVVPEITLEAGGLLQGVSRGTDGGVRAELAPGRYDVLALLLDERRKIAELEMPAWDLALDVQVPPATVIVRARLRDPSRRPPMLMVSMRSRGGDRGSFGLPDADGWRFFGVPPGEYEVRAVTSPVPGARDPIDGERLVVREGDRELSIDLFVR